MESLRIERVVRGGLIQEFGRALPREWEGSDAVVRIRRLNVVLKVARRDVDSTRVAETWAAALVAALRHALVAGAAEISRAESRGEWLGRYLTELLAGAAPGRWEYEEFANDHHAGSTASAVLALLAREAPIAPAALAWLSEMGRLEALLAIFDEAQLTQLCSLLSSDAPQGEVFESMTAGVLTPRLLAETAFALLRYVPPPNGARLATHRRAICLFVALYREKTRAVTAGVLYEALMRLELLIESGGDASAISTAARPSIGGSSDARAREESALLQRAVDMLRPHVGLPAISAVNARAAWIAGEAAGLFLLADRIERLGWPTRWQNSPLAAVHGPRLVTYCLTGVALAVLGGRQDQPERIDPTAALFAGWFGEPHLAGFRDFLARGSHAERAALLDESTPVSHPAAASWSALFDALAERLIIEFAATLRGFRRSSRGFIVKKFLAVSGRVRVEDHRVVVALAAMPLRVVLRVGGADLPVESVSWLGGRRLEFETEDL
jgi:hypothetical protein